MPRQHFTPECISRSGKANSLIRLLGFHFSAFFTATTLSPATSFISCTILDGQ